MALLFIVVMTTFILIIESDPSMALEGELIIDVWTERDGPGFREISLDVNVSQYINWRWRSTGQVNCEIVFPNNHSSSYNTAVVSRTNTVHTNGTHKIVWRNDDPSNFVVVEYEIYVENKKRDIGPPYFSFSVPDSWRSYSLEVPRATYEISGAPNVSGEYELEIEAEAGDLIYWDWGSEVVLDFELLAPNGSLLTENQNVSIRSGKIRAKSSGDYVLRWSNDDPFQEIDLVCGIRYDDDDPVPASNAIVTIAMFFIIACMMRNRHD